MSRFTQFYVAEQLRRTGWPRAKGIFRKEYVDTLAVDGAVESAVMVSVGLGAGRPELGTAVLADLFQNLPSTTESTSELFRDMEEKGELEIESHKGMLPWKALYVEHRLAPFA